MPELRQSGSDAPNQNAKVRLTWLADRQRGRVSWAQVLAVVGKDTVSRWTNDGYLHRVLPGVYAVGHRAPSVEGDLSAALLYAGPGAMLSRGTAMWWYELIDRKPTGIDVSTPRRCSSLRGVRIHDRRPFERAWHKGFPVTTVGQTLLDFAATAAFHRVRRALAKADYLGLLHVEEVQSLLGRGRPGSARLRRALQEHQPRLAMTRSRLEAAFVALCEAHDIPLPEINAVVEGWTVDALWRRERLVVELDGHRNHRSPAQIERDHRMDLELRAAAYRVNRYTETQVLHDADAVAGDVLSSLSPPARSDEPGSR